MAPGGAQALLDHLVEFTETVMSSLPGFVSANLHVSDDGLRVANYAQWESRKHFEDMQKNKGVQAHFSIAASLCESFDPATYTVAYAHDAKLPADG